MLKVKEESLLFDHAELVGKRAEHLAEIERQARQYAIERGYDEDKTEQFVAFTKDLEGDGLSAEEKAKLDLLASYIEEVEEPIAEAEHEETEATAEATSDAPYASVYGI